MQPLENLEGMISPTALASVLAISVLFGALLLMVIVRWTERFSISFLRALAVSALSVIVSLAIRFGIFAALPPPTGVDMTPYWIALMSTLALSALACAVIYAYLVRNPSGEGIGMRRALKVSLIQLGIAIGLAFALAFILALLMMSGVLPMPELPPELMN